METRDAPNNLKAADADTEQLGETLIELGERIIDGDGVYVQSAENTQSVQSGEFVYATLELEYSLPSDAPELAYAVQFKTEGEK